MHTVILPVLDEADALPRVLGSLPDNFTPLVIDNGSRDDSAHIARALGARVVVEPRRGFGAACYTGLLAAATEIVCFMDCDGSFDGHDLPQIVAPLERGDADLVLGARQPLTAKAWPWHARLANRVLVAEIRRRTGVVLRDLGPIRAARRRELLELGLVDRRFGWPLEMVLRAESAGWTVCEVPVSYAPRIGRSKVTGTIVGTASATRDMVRALQ